ncbi:hypothetical protein V6Z12_D05G141100 [Gossypium hirsutum]
MALFSSPEQPFVEEGPVGCFNAGGPRLMRVLLQLSVGGWLAMPKVSRRYFSRFFSLFAPSFHRESEDKRGKEKVSN